MNRKSKAGGSKIKGLEVKSAKASKVRGGATRPPDWKVAVDRAIDQATSSGGDTLVSKLDKNMPRPPII